MPAARPTTGGATPAISLCAGRRCWKNGAGLIISGAQAMAPPGLSVHTTGCCTECPPAAVIACDGPNTLGPKPLLLKARNEAEATRSAASLVARYAGAGQPRAVLPPSLLPVLLMCALGLNDFPARDSGLHAMWDFAGGSTRHIFRNNCTDFIESAHTTARTLPTSFYGVAMRGKEWSFEGALNPVGGDLDTCRIATQLMRSVSSDGRVRRWQWELRKQRGPPETASWFVESVGSSDRHGNFEVD